MMWLVLLFCMVTIIWCLYSGADSKVAETAVLMAFAIIGSTVGAYVFGAVWQEVVKK